MKEKAASVIVALLLVGVLASSVRIQSVRAEPSETYIPVPYHRQVKNYYCGPASLEMVFDFYGPDVYQFEIANVARTVPDGTFLSEMRRAAHFSNLSTSVGKEVPWNYTGYTSRQLGYSAFEYTGMTLDQLKSLIAADYPIIVATTGHYRVAAGYTESYFIFQDSWYGERYTMTYAAFDVDWDNSGHWGLFVSPWKVEVSSPRSLSSGDTFNVTATITYSWFPPFPVNQYPASVSTATITLPDGLTLALGQTAKKPLGSGNLIPGDSANVTWTVKADDPRNFTISVEAEGHVEGSVPPIPPDYPQPYNYTDRIGGSGQTSTCVMLAGDVNSDGTVDIYDLIVIAVAFGSTPSSPNWSPNADLMKDNVIDIYDLLVVAVNFGRTWTP